MKEEEIFLKGYDGPYKEREGIDGYLEYYNYERLHEARGYVTPREKYLGLDEIILER